MDELVKDKIEAQNEVKAKEKEEKELVAQQVLLFAFFCVMESLSYTFLQECFNFFKCILISSSYTISYFPFAFDGRETNTCTHK